MIFSGSHKGETHISWIIANKKTRTRRMLVNKKVAKLPHYKINHDYSIQPKRTKPGIHNGRVLILNLTIECKGIPGDYPISDREAYLEGGYTPEEYEDAFEKIYPGWLYRVAYEIEFMKNPAFVSSTVASSDYP